MAGCDTPIANSQRSSPEDVERPSWEERLAGLTFSETYDWQKVTPKEGKFSVMMPGTPQFTEKGGEDQWLYDVQVGKELACTIGCMAATREEMDRMGGTQGLLDTYVQKKGAGADWSIVESHDVSIDGYPGRDFTARFDMGREVFLFARENLRCREPYFPHQLGLAR